MALRCGRSGARTHFPAVAPKLCTLSTPTSSAARRAAIAFCSVPSMAARAAHAAGHCEAARPRCLSERRRRPPFHAPAFTLRAACGLAMLIGTQARSSASPKSAPVSCKPANPQDSSIEQCSSWCKADREHAQHCTVRHKPQPCIGSTSPPLCSALRCVLCVARSALLLVTRAFCH